MPQAPVVVSNRGPLGFRFAEDGSLIPRRGAGGMVVCLGPGALRDGAEWVAAALGDADRAAAEAAGAGATVDGHGFRWRPVLVDESDYHAYYDVVANGALWYCTHGLWDAPRRPRFDRHWAGAWASYRAVNEAFAATVAASAEEGTTVLLQDYQIGLMGAELAKRRPDLATALFVHTPWCTPRELAVLPDATGRELLEGMAGAGAVGFHSPRWARAFEDCCAEVLGPDLVPPTFVAPAATDVEDLRATASSAECDRELAALDEVVGDRQLIVRVDRIELSKNILRGLWAYDELLETRADLRGRVVFGAFVYPSRQGLPDYMAYAQEVRTLASVLNAKWGAPGWAPILLDEEDNYPRSVAALRRYDALMVNPVRDGLNLVAQEGPIVNERHGALVLSRQAGSWDRLGPYALSINPFDVTATAEALATALDRTPAQRRDAAGALRTVVLERSAIDWWDEVAAAARTPR